MVGSPRTIEAFPGSYYDVMNNAHHQFLFQFYSGDAFEMSLQCLLKFCTSTIKIPSVLAYVSFVHMRASSFNTSLG